MMEARKICGKVQTYHSLHKIPKWRIHNTLFHIQKQRQFIGNAQIWEEIWISRISVASLFASCTEGDYYH